MQEPPERRQLLCNMRYILRWQGAYEEHAAQAVPHRAPHSAVCPATDDSVTGVALMCDYCIAANSLLVSSFRELLLAGTTSSSVVFIDPP